MPSPTPYCVVNELMVEAEAEIEIDRILRITLGLLATAAQCCHFGVTDTLR